MDNNKRALSTQVGGTHYTDQKIQPIALAYMLNATPAFCKVAKYCSRVKDDMPEQVDKAIHCVELEEECLVPGSYNKQKDWYTLKCIKQFTDNKCIQNSLYALYYECFDSAKIYLQEFKKELENQ